MTFEAKKRRHSRVDDRSSKWIGERYCHLGTISLLHYMQVIGAGLVFFVFQPFPTEEANSSPRPTPVPQDSCTSPSANRHRFRDFLKTLKTSSRSKTSIPQSPSPPSSSLEVPHLKALVVSRDPSMAAGGPPKRCQVTWDATPTGNQVLPEVGVTPAGPSEREPRNINPATVQVASRTLIPPSSRSRSAERGRPHKASGTPRRAHSFLTQVGSLLQSSPAVRRTGRKNLPTRKRGPKVSHIDGDISEEESSGARSGSSIDDSGYGSLLSDTGVRDLPTQQHGCTSGWPTRSSPKPTTAFSTLTFFKRKKPANNAVSGVEDSVVKSETKTSSSGNSSEKNSCALLEKTEQEGLMYDPEAKNTDEEQSPTTTQGKRQQYLTIRLDNNTVSLSSEVPEQPHYPHIKVALNWESTVEASPEKERLLPFKVRVPGKTYICFTLTTLDLVLEEASLQETKAILCALEETKKSKMASAMRLRDVDNKSVHSSGIWCIVINDGNGGPCTSTFLLVSDEDVELG